MMMTGPVIDLIELERLGRLMCTVPEIAKWYNVDQQTVLDFLSRDPFKAAWTKGRLVGMDELRQSAAKVKGNVMQNYVMSGISGLRLNLEYNSSTGRCAAGTDGYKDVIAYLPMNTKDAVLTSNGMLAHRDHNGSIACVMVGNYAEVLDAARKRFEGKGKSDPQTKIEPGKITVNGTLRAGFISDAQVGTINAGSITPGRLRVGQGINITDSDLMDNSTQPQNAENQIRSMIREEMEQKFAAFLKVVNEQTKALTGQIAAMEEEIKRLGGRTVSRTPVEDLDRTCTEYGGLPGGSMASYSDNPFIRSKK